MDTRRPTGISMTTELLLKGFGLDSYSSPKWRRMFKCRHKRPTLVFWAIPRTWYSDLRLNELAEKSWIS